MLGFTREALLDKTILDLISPEDAERLERHKARLLEGCTEVGEWQMRRADGSSLSVEVSAKILPDGRWQGLVRDISERKRAEARLRESEKRLDLALRGADLGTWDWNVETGEVIFNARWAKMRGFLPEEVRPHVDSWSAGVHHEDRPRVQQALNEHFEGLAPEYEAEHRVLTKSGTWIWILDRGRVFDRDAHGRPLRMAGTELDITERKRSEAALRLSEARSSGILSISADAMISIDEDQRITMFNEGAERIFGYTKAEAMGAPLDMLLPERFRAIHRRHVERFAAGGEAARRMGERGTTIYGLRKHGVEFPADAAISKLEVGGQRLLTVSLRDVTEQHRIEAEQKFLAEVGSELAATLDYEDTLISVGRLATKSLCDLCIVGVAGEEGSIECLKAVSRDTSRAWVCDLLERILLDRRSTPLFDSALKLECTLLVQGSSPEFVAWSARHAEHLRPLRDLVPHAVILAPLEARGKRLGAIALVSTTPARSYGAADVRLAEQLAYRAALSIENAWLYRIARRAIRMRDDVLGIVAHDLRSPLGTMLLQSDLLKNPGADPGRCARKAAEKIDRAATRMNRLIQDLLDVTRLEAGRLSIEPSRLQPGQIIADTLDANKPLAAAASVELEVEVAPNTPEVWADRDRLLQAFENLVGNAIKFTPPGGLIQLGSEASNGEVLFWVRDTGAGIAPEHLPHLFDRFWQAQKDDRRGAGLGLPIVKGIVEAHGGRIWVESTPGRGTVFFFTISAAPPAELSAPKRASAPSRRRDRTPF
jgi:PAS domain S-box-containing protein